MTTDPILKAAQEREHELALQLAESLVRIDALKFELARARESAEEWKRLALANADEAAGREEQPC